MMIKSLKQKLIELEQRYHKLSDITVVVSKQQTKTISLLMEEKK